MFSVRAIRRTRRANSASLAGASEPNRLPPSRKRRPFPALSSINSSGSMSMVAVSDLSVSSCASIAASSTFICSSSSAMRSSAASNSACLGNPLPTCVCKYSMACCAVSIPSCRFCISASYSSPESTFSTWLMTLIILAPASPCRSRHSLHW